MDVLVLLVARAGAVVAKEELIDAVWEGRIIAEGTLTNAVAELRRALDDDARAPRFIETIPKRGYRLVARVEDHSPTGTRVVGTPHRRARRRGLVLSAAAVLALASVVAVVRVRSSPALDPGRVLVLPLANRSGDPSVGPLVLLVRDRMVQMAVDAGLGTMVAGDGPATDQTEAGRMGREAGAGLVVSGSAYLRDGELELETQLVDTRAGELLYAVPPVLAAEGGTAAAVAELGDRTLGAVATHLRAHAHSRLLSHAPLFAAYREFMAGSEKFGSDYRQAIAHLQRAVEIDPGYTSAWIRLATAYANAGRLNEGDAILDRLDNHRQQLTPFERLTLDLLDLRNPPAQRYAAAREINRMVSDDPIFSSLAGGLALELNRPREALGWVGTTPKEIPSYLSRSVMMAREYSLRTTALHMTGEFAAELMAAREGIRRYPGVMTLRSAEARALAASGDAKGLESVISSALASPPRGGSAGWVILDAAAAARAHDHPVLADRLAARAVAWFEAVGERHGGVDFGLGEALFHAGEVTRARRVLEASVPPPSQEPDYGAVAGWGWLGTAAARQGDRQRASELDALLAAVAEPRLRGHALFYRAAIAAWRGQHGAAADRFREARAAGWGDFQTLHDRERILLEPVVGDPVFAAALKPAD